MSCFELNNAKTNEEQGITTSDNWGSVGGCAGIYRQVFVWEVGKISGIGWESTDLFKAKVMLYFSCVSCSAERWDYTVFTW